MRELINYKSLKDIRSELILLPINNKRIYVHYSMRPEWKDIDDRGLWQHRACEMALRYGNADKVEESYDISEYSELKTSRGTKPYDVSLYHNSDLAIQMIVLMLLYFIELADYSEDKKPNLKQCEFIAKALVTEKDMYFEDIAMMLRLGISGKLGTIYNVIRIDTVSGEWLECYRNWRQKEYRKHKDLEDSRSLEKIMNKKGVPCPEDCKQDISKIGRIPRQRGERRKELITEMNYNTINEYFNANEGAKIRLDSEIDVRYDSIVCDSDTITKEQYRQFEYNRFLINLNK